MILGDEHRKALGLGLSGAHRTGKTTIAREFAANMNCPLVLSSATAVAKDMGIRADIGLPFSVRLDFQAEVLRRFCADCDREGGTGVFVTDRTPLDFAAYALTDWHSTRSTPELDVRLQTYVADCMEATSRYFFTVGVIQPGIRYEVRDDKPAPNELYQEYLNTVLIGLAADHRVKSHFHLMPRYVLKNEERVERLTDYFKAKVTDYQAFLTEYLHHA